MSTEDNIDKIFKINETDNILNMSSQVNACIQEVIPGEPSNATIQDGIKFSNKWIVMQGHRKVCAHLGCPPIIDRATEDVNIWSDALLMNERRNPKKGERYTLILRGFDDLQ